MNLFEVASALQKFTGSDLTSTLAKIEESARGATSDELAEILATANADSRALAAAAALKHAAGQINVTIHAVGILLCLPHILEPGEHVEYVSLGAGNTGRSYDLETNYRIAEFKFIRWRGGPESIRQNQLFKDFFLLAEGNTSKRKCLYVLGTEQPLKFLMGGRAIESVLSRNLAVHTMFRQRFGTRFQKVRDYYFARQDCVSIEDVSIWLPELVAEALGEAPD